MRHLKLVKNDEVKPSTQHARTLKMLEDYLESHYFLDYELMPKSAFGSVNEVAVHQCVDLETLEHDVDQALETFCRDGYPEIYFYI